MAATALIIEDDPSLASVFAEALEASNFETEVILDGQDALDRLAETTPNLLLVDLHLPNVGGAKIVAEARSQKHLANTRIIVASGDAALADRVRDQVDFVLDKPVSFHQLRLLSERIRPAD